MANREIDYFPEKTPFRLSGWEYPDYRIYIHKYFSSLNATNANLDSEGHFYIVEESDGWCQLESVKWKGCVITCSRTGLIAKSHFEVKENTLFKITRERDGSLRISSKKEPGKAVYMRFITKFPGVPGIGLIPENDISEAAKWVISPLQYGDTPDYTPSARRGPISLPDDQHLCTSHSDVMDVIQYIASVAGRGITDVHLYPAKIDHSAQELIRHYCVFGECEQAGNLPITRVLEYNNVCLHKYPDTVVNGVSYANLQIRYEQNTLAFALIQTGITFGMRRIRRALYESMMYACEVRLSRQPRLKKQGSGILRTERNGNPETPTVLDIMDV